MRCFFLLFLIHLWVSLSHNIPCFLGDHYLCHHFSLYQTLVKLRLPDFPPEVLEATQPNNLVNACLQVLHLLKHLQGIPFASVLRMTGTILSASRTQNQQLIAIANKKLRGMFTFRCVYIYIYILIYTHTHEKTYAPLRYIYIVISHLICQCCFQKKQTPMTSKQ